LEFIFEEESINILLKPNGKLTKDEKRHLDDAR